VTGTVGNLTGGVLPSPSIVPSLPVIGGLLP
jgi:hypothetical protein